MESKMFPEFENDDSPVHIACTQEGSGNVDVVWDWNSPQAKQGKRRIKKNLLIKQSPKTTLKRHPSNNRLQNFEKLREELLSLKEAISVPDHEESLILSPLEEAEYKDISNIQNTSSKLSFVQENDMEDLFNDSADEQLILLTQIIENINSAEQPKVPVPEHTSPNFETKYPITEEVPTMKSSHELETANVMQLADGVKDSNIKKFAPATLHTKLDHIEGTEIIKQNNISNIARNNKKFPRSGSENECATYNRQTNPGKVEFHRTQSFEITMNVEHTKDMLPESKLHEIERNRREALARLELKRKLEYSESPTKCTAEEIERKRLAAVAKRETKRQQDLIIKRNRQEALKRLELNRKKNATIVKSSLSKIL